MSTSEQSRLELWPRVIITLVCFGMGMAVAAQWRSQASSAMPPLIASSVDQAILMRNLVESNAQLRQEVRALERQMAELAQEESRHDALRSLTGELDRLRIANGLVEVTGPGIEIKIDSRLGIYDLQDLINELRNAGAEAISLNGARIVANSIIAQQGQRTIIDGIVFSTPYTFLAIGDPATLTEAVSRRGSTLDLLASGNPDLKTTVERRQDQRLAAFRRPYVFTYAAIAP